MDKKKNTENHLCLCFAWKANKITTSSFGERTTATMVQIKTSTPDWPSCGVKKTKQLAGCTARDETTSTGLAHVAGPPTREVNGNG